MPAPSLVKPVPTKVLVIKPSERVVIVGVPASVRVLPVIWYCMFVVPEDPLFQLVKSRLPTVIPVPRVTTLAVTQAEVLVPLPNAALSGVVLFQVTLAAPFHQLAVEVFQVPEPFSIGGAVGPLLSQVRLAACAGGRAARATSRRLTAKFRALGG